MLRKDVAKRKISAAASRTPSAGGTSAGACGTERRRTSTVCRCYLLPVESAHVKRTGRGAPPKFSAAIAGPRTGPNGWARYCSSDEAAEIAALARRPNVYLARRSHAAGTLEGILAQHRAQRLRERRDTRISA